MIDKTDDNEFPVSKSRLGKYSNDPAKAAEEEAAARQATVHEIGPYRLTRHPRWQLWEVARIDGKSVPKGLAGHWQTLQDFRNALANFSPERTG